MWLLFVLLRLLDGSVFLVVGSYCEEQISRTNAHMNDAFLLMSIFLFICQGFPTRLVFVF